MMVIETRTMAALIPALWRAAAMGSNVRIYKLEKLVSRAAMTATKLTTTPAVTTA